jgi:hypothetical protein
VKPELALDVTDKFKTGDIKGGLAEILVDPADVDPLLAAGLTSADVLGIVEFVSGTALGELSASVAS